MFKYMVGNDILGNYAPAFEYTQAAILEKDPVLIAKCAHVDYDEKASAFRFESFGQRLTVTLPSCKVAFEGSNDIPILEWRLAVLHYLATADGSALSDELTHFRKMPGGNAYESAFVKRSINILKSTICNKPVENIKQVCEALGGEFVKSSADVHAVFNFMPHFPVTVQIWIGDEEMEGNANVLFNARASHYLPTEDMAVVASVISRFMMKQHILQFSV